MIVKIDNTSQNSNPIMLLFYLVIRYMSVIVIVFKKRLRHNSLEQQKVKYYFTNIQYKTSNSYAS